MNIRNIIANNIKYYRIKRNWSQEELASKIGTTVPYLSSLENAKRNMRIDYVEYIASIFDIPIINMFEKREIVSKKRVR